MAASTNERIALSHAIPALSAVAWRTRHIRVEYGTVVLLQPAMVAS